MNSDKRVLELRKIISQKEKALGLEPKATYKTNLLYDKRNILTLDLVGVRDCIAEVLYKVEKLKQANELLGVDLPISLEDTLADLVLRGKILSYKSKVSEINTLKKKLDGLRSEDLRISDELDDLESILKP